MISLILLINVKNNNNNNNKYSKSNLQLIYFGHRFTRSSSLTRHVSFCSRGETKALRYENDIEKPQSEYESLIIIKPLLKQFADLSMNHGNKLQTFLISALYVTGQS